MKPSNSVLSLNSIFQGLWEMINFLLTPLKVILLIVISSIIPLHGKRMMFVVSVYLHVLKLKSGANTALDKLNEALKLADSTEALTLPFKLYELLWSEKLESVIRNQKSELFFGETKENQLAITEMCGQLVQRTPMWLRYGDFGAMLKDSVRAVECINKQDNLT